MLSLLISLIVVCLIASIAWWAISQMPLPQPMRNVVVALFAIVLILVIVYYAGGLPQMRLPR